MKKGQVFIATSGFMYPHWKGHFYPKNIPQKDWFEYYCQHFNSVELNVSFYRLPKKETFEKWREKAGPPAGGFIFSIKGSRYITHIKRLKDCQEPLERFFGNAEALKSGAKTQRNVVLWQLPPRMKANPERLEEFLKALAHLRGGKRHLGGEWRHAFEFRHETWLDKAIYRILKKYKAAIVFQDFPDWPRTEEVTADFVYLRFHGRTRLYTSGYSNKELKAWAEKIKKWQKKGLNTYAYFNNDALGYAVENAQTLKTLVS